MLLPSADPLSRERDEPVDPQDEALFKAFLTLLALRQGHRERLTTVRTVMQLRRYERELCQAGREIGSVFSLAAPKR